MQSALCHEPESYRKLWICVLQYIGNCWQRLVMDPSTNTPVGILDQFMHPCRLRCSISERFIFLIHLGVPKTGNNSCCLSLVNQEFSQAASSL